MAQLLLIPLWVLRVIVSDDVPTTGSGASTEYSTFFFTQGAVVTGEQAPIRTQTDRDILALEEAMAVDLHYIYHPVGLEICSFNCKPNKKCVGDSWFLVESVRDKEYRNCSRY